MPTLSPKISNWRKTGSNTLGGLEGGWALEFERAAPLGRDTMQASGGGGGGAVLRKGESQKEVPMAVVCAVLRWHPPTASEHVDHASAGGTGPTAFAQQKGTAEHKSTGEWANAGPQRRCPWVHGAHWVRAQAGAQAGGGGDGWRQGCIGRGGAPPPLQGAQPTPSHCPPDGKRRLQ